MLHVQPDLPFFAVIQFVARLMPWQGVYKMPRKALAFLQTFSFVGL